MILTSVLYNLQGVNSYLNVIMTLAVLCLIVLIAYQEGVRYLVRDGERIEAIRLAPSDTLILVPIEGGFLSMLAAEFAFTYAQAAHARRGESRWRSPGSAKAVARRLRRCPLASPSRPSGACGGSSRSSQASCSRSAASGTDADANRKAVREDPSLPPVRFR